VIPDAWPRRAWALAAVAVLSFAACLPEPAPTPTPSPTATPLPTPVTTTYALKATGWYGGLVVHLDRVVAVLDAGGGPVRLDLQLENPGNDPGGLGGPILLAAGGRGVEPVPGTSMPEVPAAGRASVTLEFDVDGAFEMDRAAIRIGRSAEHQVIVPLLPGSLDLVTLEPITTALTGKAAAGALSVALASAELRADLPDWGLELAHDTLALSVTYAARYTGNFSGGFAFTGSNIRLRLPSGREVAVREDGHSQSLEALKPGVTVMGLTSRFEVPTPGPGEYALVVRDGKESSAIPFTIEVAAPAG